MSTKVQHQYKVSSFTSAWCLKPPSTTPRYTTATTSNGPKKSYNRHAHKDSSRVTVEKTSPRVRCMGQIKCHIPLPRSIYSVRLSSISSRSSTPQSNTSVLKRDAGDLCVTIAAIVAPLPPEPRSVSASPVVITSEFGLLVLKRVSSTRVIYEEMDPPQPVERKEAKQKDSVSLLKRRCGQGGRLQVQLELARNKGVDQCVRCIQHVV